MGVKFGESRGIHIIIMFVWVLLGISSMALSAPVAQQDDQETQTSSSSSSSSETSSQYRRGFDITAILALAGATSTPVQSGTSEEQTEPSVVSTTSKYGDLKRILRIAGASPSPVSGYSSYTGRRKRQIDWEKENVIPIDEVLVKKVIAEDVNKDTDPEGSVKVKTLSNVGDQI